MAKIMACTTCETVDKPRNHTRGSVGIELFLWLLFIVPGLLYSLWRMNTRAKVCRACGSPQLVPADSPAGRRITSQAAA